MQPVDFIQLYFEILPSAPKFTEKDLVDLSSKVYLVTGGASGVGLELCKCLYSKSATVYIAGRSQPNADAAIASIRSAHPSSTGTLKFLLLDLSDLRTIKPAALSFLADESRLDVVWHNAGIMLPENGAKDAQGHELQMGTNVLGPWLLQHFLTPLLHQTAARPDIPADSVRVVWVASMASNVAPKGGIHWDDINWETTAHSTITALLTFDGGALKYGQSKAANIILAAEAAKRWAGSGVVSLSLNPGNLKSNLDRTTPGWVRFFLNNFFNYPAYYGGLTELFAGLSPTITVREHAGRYVIPWGKFGMPRKDIVDALVPSGERLWQWCWDECRLFM